MNPITLAPAGAAATEAERANRNRTGLPHRTDSRAALAQQVTHRYLQVVVTTVEAARSVEAMPTLNFLTEIAGRPPMASPRRQSDVDRITTAVALLTVNPASPSLWTCTYGI